MSESCCGQRPESRRACGGANRSRKTIVPTWDDARAPHVYIRHKQRGWKPSRPHGGRQASRVRGLAAYISKNEKLKHKETTDMSDDTIESTRRIFERTGADLPQLQAPAKMGLTWQPPQAGEALRQMLAAAPDLGTPGGSRAAEKRLELHKANREWGETRALVFSRAGLDVEIAEGGVRVRCKANGHEKFIAAGTELTPAVLTCSGGCNRFDADPDAGSNRSW